MKIQSHVFILILVCIIFCCFSPAITAQEKPGIQVVTTIPVETTLTREGTTAAAETWVAMINGAKKTLDVAQFYLVNKPDNLPDSKKPHDLGKLEPVILAVLNAAKRGVKVRFLVGTAISKNMENGTRRVVERLKEHSNITVTSFDWKQFTGGILHAKYFVVDNTESFVGSQNFDWRSLEHIHETGLRIK
ncbi:MAG: hypothetical protein GY765_37440, partial [bacterium]|nr:hypothetical protein [bacterium]